MIIFTIIGALVGAGFASGQEIYLFFYRYGTNGIFGIFLFVVISIFVIYKVLKIVYQYPINTYKDFLNHIFSDKKILNHFTNIIVNCFLGITFFIMISGFGAYFHQEYGLSKWLGVILLAIFSYLSFLRNMNFITKLNSIVVPILILCIILIGGKNISNLGIFELTTKIETKHNLFWILDAILYASYNLILLIPVLINLKNYLKGKKQILFVSIMTGIVVDIISLFTFFLLINVDIDFSNLEMPIVYVIQNKFMEFKYLYGIIILIAIFTTANSVGISLLNNICQNKKSFPQFAGILCITSIIISPIGFSNLVKILFPLFGYLGLIQIFAIGDGSFLKIFQSKNK